MIAEVSDQQVTFAVYRHVNGTAIGIGECRQHLAVLVYLSHLHIMQ